MYTRNMVARLIEALQDTPAVFLRGARQTGKSTLVQELVRDGFAGKYVTLDSATVLAAAAQDPAGFLAGLPRPLIVDEVQRAPGLLVAMKEVIDKDRKPGQLVLTGSSNWLALPTVSESLAGRIEVLTLWPLAQAELYGGANCIDRLFSENPQTAFSHAARRPTSAEELLDALVRGGFPEVLTRATARRRAAWFDSYLTTILERDVRDLAAIQDLSALPRLLRLLGARAASLLNQSEISRSSGIPNASLVRYMDIFERLFLSFRLPAWSANLGKRLIKSPKLYLSDTGLAAHLVGADAKRLAAEPELAGRLFENFVVCELLKQASWSETPVRLHHYRTTTGSEVDLVLESAAGKVVAVEIKHSSTLQGKHFAGLRGLQESLRDAFALGVVLYAGQELVPFGEKLLAAPVSMLWAPA